MKKYTINVRSIVRTIGHWSLKGEPKERYIAGGFLAENWRDFTTLTCPSFLRARKICEHETNRVSLRTRKRYVPSSFEKLFHARTSQ